MMTTMTSKPLTHTSYAAAVADLKAGKASFARWDGGEGFISEGTWCPRRKRVIFATFNPNGTRCA